MSILQKLTEGIVDRDLAKEGAALQSKWEATGLLEGISDDRERASMSRLLENQAKELLREASTMASGDVEGFAAVAFPIVRRVFGGLLANDLVSVQPMSLPSGLIFFLDFTFADARAGFAAGESLYGGNVAAKGLVDGVTLGEDAGQFYNMAAGYSSPTGSVTCTTPAAATSHTDGSTVKAVGYDPDLTGDHIVVLSPVAGDYSGTSLAVMNSELTTAVAVSGYVTDAGGADVVGADEAVGVIDTTNGDLLLCARADSGGTTFGISSTNNDVMIARLRLVRRHTKVVAANGSDGLHEVSNISQLVFRIVSVHDCGNTPDTASVDLENAAQFTLATANTAIAAGTAQTLNSTIAAAIATDLAASDLTFEIPLRDNFDAGGSIGSVVGAHQWPLELASDTAGGRDGGEKDVIPEIDIKVDSVAVTAVTKKLKAKWSPELG